MQASINLLDDQGESLDRFDLSYESVNRTEIATYLDSRYELKDGYDISYVDEDGDEIAVEFDDDYEVAKLTHEKANLELNVKITNSEWINIFKGRKEAQELKTEQKVQPSLLEPLIKHSVEDIMEDVEDPHIPFIFYEKIIQQKQNQEQETQTHLPVQSKRTETQTSELQSVEEISHAKPPKKKQVLDFIEDRIPFVQEESENEKPELMEPKISQKPKEKKKKQKISKPQKKPKGLNEKDIKKLVKREVFKLLPQIAEKIKFMEEADDSGFQQALQKKTESKLSPSPKLTHCTVCSESLNIPFYVNSKQGIIMCAICEQTDCSKVSLVKIRDEEMLEKLSWAQPLSYLAKADEESDSIKQLTEIKKEFMDSIKKQFESMVKGIKDESKKQKKEKAKSQKKDKKEGER